MDIGFFNYSFKPYFDHFLDKIQIMGILALLLLFVTSIILGFVAYQLTKIVSLLEMGNQESLPGSQPGSQNSH